MKTLSYGWLGRRGRRAQGGTGARVCLPSLQYGLSSRRARSTQGGRTLLLSIAAVPRASSAIGCWAVAAGGPTALELQGLHSLTLTLLPWSRGLSSLGGEWGGEEALASPGQGPQEELARGPVRNGVGN